jgi:Sec-independent protein translocase protein TatA
MFNISWGETFVIAGLGIALIGRHDLPKAAYFVGKQTGRLVGLLQGARIRADQYAAASDLQQLQNELRSGLRELDQVKSELAVATSVNRSLGTMVPSANRQVPVTLQQKPVQPHSSPTSPSIHAAPSPVYSSRQQSIGAIAEAEWAQQGIGFQSRAEQGVGVEGWRPSKTSSGNVVAGSAAPTTSGSFLLSRIYQETLIFDQYDRVVQEQDSALKDRVAGILAKQQQESDTGASNTS